MNLKKDKVLVDFRLQLSHALDKLSELTDIIEHQELFATTSELKARLEDPFLFVIVGEVKAGKSSFINALLGTEGLCKVAPSPMTDSIQQIVFGEEKTEEINPHLKKIFLPHQILKEIAIVDTPGTNTIVDHHQEITERFIPHADLIVFVFEAKNPYRESAWKFFDYISEEWRKKIVFVLQQKDLMPSEDLAINKNGVIDYALKKGIPNPKVFCVSALQELQSNPDSGFAPLKTYIDHNITGGKAPYLKLTSNINTSESINTKIGKSVDLRNAQFELDTAFRDEISKSLEAQSVKTLKQIDFLVENLLASYDRICIKAENELSGTLSFIPMIKRSLSTFFGNKSADPQALIEKQINDFEKDLNIALKERLNDGVIDIADSIQMMGKLVDSKIKSSQTVLEESDEIFSDIADKRANVLRDLQKAFTRFLNSSENFYDKKMLESSKGLAPNVATGGGMAVAGIILASVLQGAVYDITGGILTSVGLLFAGATIGFKKRTIMRGFRNEIKTGRTKLEEEVTIKLKEYTKGIRQKIEANFSRFDIHLQEEEAILTKIINLRQHIATALTTLSKSVDQHINSIS